MFNPRIYVVNGSKPVRNGHTMFFMNHTSVADSFLDCFLTGGSSYLSRLLIIFLCPGPSFCGYLLNFVWFFWKFKKINRNWFTKFMQSKWMHRWVFPLPLNYRPNSGCIVYPEGKISQWDCENPLKTGVMEVAYNLNCPSQIILTRGKVCILFTLSLAGRHH